MRKIKLTKQEKEIEEALLKGEYVEIDRDEFKQIADAISFRKRVERSSIMKHWDYRIIKKCGSKSEAASYQIHEVYYRGDGVIDAWTESPVQPHGDTLHELRADIRFFLQAFRHPVLELQLVDGKQVLIEDAGAL